MMGESRETQTFLPRSEIPVVHSTTYRVNNNSFLRSSSIFTLRLSCVLDRDRSLFIIWQSLKKDAEQFKIFAKIISKIFAGND